MGKGRPFDSLEEMTESLISNWNERVKPGDMIYHLGDFMLTWGKKHIDDVDRMISRLNGCKFLIRGNHDRKEVYRNERWNKVDKYYEIKSPIDGTTIVMCHYPIRSWNKQGKGSFMLHGHCHGNLRQPPGRIMDVGVDCNNFAPVSIEEVHEFMKNRDIYAEDHHTADCNYQ